MNEIRDLLGGENVDRHEAKRSRSPEHIVHDPPVLIFDEATSRASMCLSRVHC